MNIDKITGQRRTSVGARLIAPAPTAKRLGSLQAMASLRPIRLPADAINRAPTLAPFHAG